jgi:hypothetical protein
MTFVLPPDTYRLHTTTIPGTPDPTSSPSLPDRELLALANVFPPMTQFPTTNTKRAPISMTMTSCASNRHRLRQRLRKEKKKRQHRSPIISPLIPTSPTPNLEHTTKHGNDSETSLDLYYRACNNHRPEMGASNAESVARDEAIKKDVKRMKRERQTRR